MCEPFENEMIYKIIQNKIFVFVEFKEIFLQI